MVASLKAVSLDSLGFLRTAPFPILEPFVSPKDRRGGFSEDGVAGAVAEWTYEIVLLTLLGG